MAVDVLLNNMYSIANGTVLAGSIVLMLRFLWPLNLKDAVISIYGGLISDENRKSIERRYYSKNPKALDTDGKRIYDICLNRFALIYIFTGTLMSFSSDSRNRDTLLVFAVVCLLCIIAFLASEIKSRRCAGSNKSSRVKQSKNIETKKFSGSINDFINGYIEQVRKTKISYTYTALLIIIIMSAFLALFGLASFIKAFKKDAGHSASSVVTANLFFACGILMAIEAMVYSGRSEYKKFISKISRQAEHKRLKWVKHSIRKVMEHHKLSNSLDLINECRLEQKKCDWLRLFRGRAKMFIWLLIIPSIVSLIICLCAFRRLTWKYWLILAIFPGSLLDICFLMIISVLKDFQFRYNTIEQLINDIDRCGY